MADAPGPADSPRPARRLPSGWAALDERLGGGWPVGKLVEIRGQGGTSLALGAVRAAQAAGLPVAWVDGAGTFCPATAPVDPGRLTLVQPGPPPGASPTGESPGPSPGARPATTPPAPRTGGPTASRRRPPGPALFAADVLLRSRAYALVALDLPAGGRGPVSAWFRLARLAARAHTTLLLLHPESGGPAHLLSGSACSVLADVTLRAADVPAWGEWPAPDLEVVVRRDRSAGLLGERPDPLLLPTGSADAGP